jgi:hypothetical protein
VWAGGLELSSRTPGLQLTHTCQKVHQTQIGQTTTPFRGRSQRCRQTKNATHPPAMYIPSWATVRVCGCVSMCESSSVVYVLRVRVKYEMYVCNYLMCVCVCMYVCASVCTCVCVSAPALALAIRQSINQAGPAGEANSSATRPLEQGRIIAPCLLCVDVCSRSCRELMPCNQAVIVLLR